MPELPEVEHIVTHVRPLLRGRRIERLVPVGPRGALVSHAKLIRSTHRASALARALAGRRIGDVRRRAKLIIVQLDGGDALVIHLKITGKLWVDAAGAAVTPHERFRLAIAGGRALRFEDQRKFGWMGLFDADGVAELTAGLGPEPLVPGFGKAALATALERRRRTTIKAALLDQSVIAGIGNIYADEILFAARVRPDRRVGSLSDPELGRLHRQTRRILARAVRERDGAPDQKRVGAGGKRGASVKRITVEVFQRTGEPCPRCRRPITRIVHAGRGTHFCDQCQK